MVERFTCFAVKLSYPLIILEINTGKACATTKIEGGATTATWKSKACDDDKLYICQYTDECPVGYSGDPCTACEVGTYKATTGSASCTSCGAPKTTTGTGSDNVNDCGKRQCSIWIIRQKVPIITGNFHQL